MLCFHCLLIHYRSFFFLLFLSLYILICIVITICYLHQTEKINKMYMYQQKYCSHKTFERNYHIINVSSLRIWDEWPYMQSVYLIWCENKALKNCTSKQLVRNKASKEWKSKDWFLLYSLSLIDYNVGINHFGMFSYFNHEGLSFM